VLAAPFVPWYEVLRSCIRTQFKGYTASLSDARLSSSEWAADLARGTHLMWCLQIR
jgi:hypothetical protein